MSKHHRGSNPRTQTPYYNSGFTDPEFLLSAGTLDEQYNAIMGAQGIHEATTAFFCGSAAVQAAFYDPRDERAFELFTHGTDRLREAADLGKIGCGSACLSVRAQLTELYANRVYMPRRFEGSYPEPEALRADPSLLGGLFWLGKEVLDRQEKILDRLKSKTISYEAFSTSNKELTGVGNEIAVLLLLEEMADEIDDPEWRPAKSLFSDEHSPKKSKGQRKRTWDSVVLIDNDTFPFYKIEVKSNKEGKDNKIYDDEISVVYVNQDLRDGGLIPNNLWLLKTHLGLMEDKSIPGRDLRIMQCDISRAKELLFDKLDEVEKHTLETSEHTGIILT